MKLIFAGCSFSADDHCYPYILKQQYNTDIKNLSEHGNSNFDIFLSAAKAIIEDAPSILFVQWSALNRLTLHPIPGARVRAVTNGLTDEVNAGSGLTTSKNIAFSKKELESFGKMYNQLFCDYQLILTLIDYCKILTTMSQGKHRIVFINGLLPWTSDMLKNDNKLDNLSEYTKEILYFNNSPDNEIRHFLDNLRTAMNTLDQNKWVNMFNSILNNRIDTVSDIDYHPGIKTHTKFAEQIIEYLDNE